MLPISGLSSQPPRPAGPDPLSCGSRPGMMGGMRFLLGLLLVLVLAAIARLHGRRPRRCPRRSRSSSPRRWSASTPRSTSRSTRRSRGLSRSTSSSSRTGRRRRCSRSASPGSAAVDAGDARPRCASRGPIGKRALPDLQAGAGADRRHAARTTSVRPADEGGVGRARLRGAASTRRASRVRLDAPLHQPRRRRDGRLQRRRRPTSSRACRWATSFYPGFPASGAGGPARTRACKVAFFALLYDQDLNTPIRLFARTRPATRRTRRSTTRCSRRRSARAGSS